VLAYMDVDLSTDLAALDELLTPLLEGRGDLAIGSRLAPGADVEIQLKERKGRIDLKIGWKQRTTTPVSALRVSVGPGAV